MVEISDKYTQVYDKIIKLLIWDCSGLPKYQQLINSGYYKKMQAFVLVYDITNRISFDRLKLWIEKIRRYGYQTDLLLIVGNKIDLGEQREVSFEEG